jgi:hypothetical protein
MAARNLAASPPRWPENDPVAGVEGFADGDAAGISLASALCFGFSFGITILMTRPLMALSEFPSEAPALCECRGFRF